MPTVNEELLQAMRTASGRGLRFRLETLPPNAGKHGVVYPWRWSAIFFLPRGGGPVAEGVDIEPAIAIRQALADLDP